VQPEMMPVARVVPLDGRPRLGSSVRAYRGDWRGRWEGDTMVIETTNYSDKTAWRGSTENLKVIERLTMTSPTSIRYQFTVEDPTYYTQPWKGETRFGRSNDSIFEFACHEGNYSLPFVLLGAREMDAKAAAKQQP